MPYGILFLIFILILKQSKSNETATANKNISKKIEDINDDYYIQYLSNGKLLVASHLYYYANLLDLSGVKNIDYLTIEDAAKKRQKLINKVQNDSLQVSSIDVAAAKYFLLDRWTYLTSHN